MTNVQLFIQNRKVWNKYDLCYYLSYTKIHKGNNNNNSKVHNTSSEFSPIGV